jgi:hypothetical protein
MTTELLWLLAGLGLAPFLGYALYLFFSYIVLRKSDALPQPTNDSKV